MKKVLLIIGILMYLSGNLIAQKVCEFTDFELKLAKFKYSLYKDLEEFDSQDIQQFDFLKEGTSIRKKTDKFVEDNKDEIRKYQEVLLKKYSVFEIDTSQFVTDSTILELKSFLSEMEKTFEVEMGRMIKIQPLNFALVIKNALCARKYSAMEFGLKSVKNSVAAPIYATKKINKNSWLIFIDEYDMAYLFKFEFEGMNYSIVNIYERRKEK